MDSDFVIEEDLSTLSNEELIERYNEIDAFLKLVNEEIKKTDIGDEDEKD